MDYDIDRITTAISAATHVNCTDEGVLIFLDEIQEAKNGITSLKYFQENAPHLHVIVAGSLLGIQLFAPKRQELLKYYYYVGGMPEAVQSFCQYRDWQEVRAIQKEILRSYERDFSKHAPGEIAPQIHDL